MAATQKHQTSGDDIILRAKDFWTKNQKPISIVLILIVVLGGGWYAYKNYVVAPKETEA